MATERDVERKKTAVSELLFILMTIAGVIAVFGVSSGFAVKLFCLISGVCR